MLPKPLLPNRLCLKDGVVTMRDGSDVQVYLRSRAVANADEVVILTQKEAQSLVDDAYAYRISQLLDDERFALAA